MDSKSSFGCSNIQDKNNEEFLIESLWILERKSGLCLFKEIYNEIIDQTISNDLICGFFSAVSDITNEAFRTDLQYIKLMNLKIYFEFIENLIFIIAINDDEFNDYEIQYLSCIIAEIFINKYQPYLYDWNNNVTYFKDFSEDLEKIVRRKPFYEFFN